MKRIFSRISLSLYSTAIFICAVLFFSSVPILASSFKEALEMVSFELWIILSIGALPFFFIAATYEQGIRRDRNFVWRGALYLLPFVNLFFLFGRGCHFPDCRRRYVIGYGLCLTYLQLSALLELISYAWASLNLLVSVSMVICSIGAYHRTFSCLKKLHIEPARYTDEELISTPPIPTTYGWLIYRFPRWGWNFIVDVYGALLLGGLLCFIGISGILFASGTARTYYWKEQARKAGLIMTPAEYYAAYPIKNAVGKPAYKAIMNLPEVVPPASETPFELNGLIRKIDPTVEKIWQGCLNSNQKQLVELDKLIGKYTCLLPYRQVPWNQTWNLETWYKFNNWISVLTAIVYPLFQTDCNADIEIQARRYETILTYMNEMRIELNDTYARYIQFLIFAVNNQTLSKDFLKNRLIYLEQLEKDMPDELAATRAARLIDVDFSYQYANQQGLACIWGPRYYAEFWKNQVEQAKLPWGSWYFQNSKEFSEYGMQRHVKLRHQVISDYEKQVLLEDSSVIQNEFFSAYRAQLAMMRLVLAVELYRREFNKMPINLAEAAEKYCASTSLIDPFSGRPYIFQTGELAVRFFDIVWSSETQEIQLQPVSEENNGYRIYSLGPDGKDDEGQGWLLNADSFDLELTVIF